MAGCPHQHPSSSTNIYSTQLLLYDSYLPRVVVAYHCPRQSGRKRAASLQPLASCSPKAVPALLLLSRRRKMMAWRRAPCLYSACVAGAMPLLPACWHLPPFLPPFPPAYLPSLPACACHLTTTFSCLPYYHHPLVPSLFLLLCGLWFLPQVACLGPGFGT